MGYFLSLSDNDLRVWQVALIFLALASEAEKNHSKKKDNGFYQYCTIPKVTTTRK